MTDVIAVTDVGDLHAVKRATLFPKGEETIADLGQYFKQIFISNSRSDDYMGNGRLYNPLVKQISLF